MTSASGTVVPSTLTRAYPKRISSGSWIAMLTANSVQDRVSIVTRVRPPSGAPSASPSSTASAVPAVRVARKLASAQA